MGPLKGIKIIEIAGIGPGPFCAMMLADMGADIIRVERPQVVETGSSLLGSWDSPGMRGRRSIGVDLKNPDGIETILRLVEDADVIMEGFRPGVMERLGLGPEVCDARNPRIVYGRMTGFGQTGPYSKMAGHDINYIALAGALEPIGRRGQPPTPPLNLVGDFGGGGMLLALGICGALVERATSGKGQVVDAAMVDGSAALITMMYGGAGPFGERGPRGTNMVDSGAPFYDAYETKDGKYVSVGSIEPQFYVQFLELTGLANEKTPDQMDQSSWVDFKERVKEVFLTKTRDEWCDIMDGTDVCFAPVLTPEEATQHPHNVERGTFVDFEGVVQPAPAPRFSRTESKLEKAACYPGLHTEEVLAEFGFSADEISSLSASGAVKQGKA